MGHNLKLTPFKDIFKSSWVFYKSNWKTVVLLFLPLEIATLFCFIALDLIPPETDFFVATFCIVVFNFCGFVFSAFNKIITLDAPYLMERISFGENTPKAAVWYTSLVKRIIPISLVLFLIGVANFGFISLVVMIAGLLFVLFSLLLKSLSAYSAVGIVLAVGVTVSLAYTALRYIIKFFVGGMFSIYMYIFDKRLGLDAVVSSFLLTSGREFGIFWRSVGIWLVTTIPFFILVFPINATLIYQSFNAIYFQAMVLHVQPTISSPSTTVAVILDIMTSVAGLLSVSFFVVMNYFLWRDVKATAMAFEETKYQKTRKYIRSLIGFGAVLFVAAFAMAIIYGAMFGQ
ncbi:MAG: hypothetical protein V4469_04820 [Patescibacteria group bacterium]